MKRLFIPGCYLSWGIVHLGRYVHHPIPFFNDHGTDFLAVPVMAHLALLVMRRFIVRDDAYTYPLGYLLFIALYVSVIFEGVMPRFSAHYTADWWDVVAYFEGSILYYFVFC